MSDKKWSKEKWDEFQETLMIIGALMAWLMHGAAVAFVPEFSKTEAAPHIGRFVDSIVLMVFTFKFTKSLPRGNGS